MEACVLVNKIFHRAARDSVTASCEGAVAAKDKYGAIFNMAHRLVRLPCAFCVLFGYMTQPCSHPGSLMAEG